MEGRVTSWRIHTASTQACCQRLKVIKSVAWRGGAEGNTQVFVLVTGLMAEFSMKQVLLVRSSKTSCKIKERREDWHGLDLFCSTCPLAPNAVVETVREAVGNNQESGGRSRQRPAEGPESPITSPNMIENESRFRCPSSSLGECSSRAPESRGRCKIKPKLKRAAEVH